MLIFKAHAKPITAVAFSPDGTLLATGSGTERIARLWQLAAPGGGLLEKPKKLYEWPHEWVQNVAFSTDSKTVVASSMKQLVAYSTADGKPVFDIAEQASAHKMVVSKQDVIYAHGFVETKRWTIAGKALPAWKPAQPGENYGAGPVAVTSDGKRIAAHWAPKQGPSSRFEVRDDAGTLIVGYEREKVSVQPARARFGKADSLFATAFGPDIVIWDAKQGGEVKTLNIGKKHVPDVAFTAGGAQLIAVSNDETVRRWDTKSWKELDPYTWKVGKLTALDVSADGDRVASGGQLGKVVIWDVVD